MGSFPKPQEWFTHLSPQWTSTPPLSGDSLVFDFLIAFVTISQPTQYSTQIIITSLCPRVLGSHGGTEKAEHGIIWEIPEPMRYSPQPFQLNHNTHTPNPKQFPKVQSSSKIPDLSTTYSMILTWSEEGSGNKFLFIFPRWLWCVARFEDHCPR